jgi:Kinesin motor domain
LITGTVFAYGQTSSGKTYTMMGAAEHGDSGILPRCITDIYNAVERVGILHILKPLFDVQKNYCILLLVVDFSFQCIFKALDMENIQTVFFCKANSATD